MIVLKLNYYIIILLFKMPPAAAPAAVAAATNQKVQIIRRRRHGDGIDDDYDEERLKGHQHRRRNDNHRVPSSSSSSLQSTVKTCIQFIVMSSVIPFLFFVRMAQQDEDSLLFQNRLTLPDALPEPFAFLPDLLRTYAGELQHTAKSSIIELDQEWLDSDIVELHHCRSLLTSTSMSWANFTSWAGPWVNQTTLQLVKAMQQQQIVLNEEDQQSLQQEIVLELLELYGTQQKYCKFYRYHRPSVVLTVQEGGDAALLDTALIPPPTPPQPYQHQSYSRLAIVITVRPWDHSEHIQRLIQAIHMPHHFIILHVFVLGNHHQHQHGNKDEKDGNTDNDKLKARMEQIAQDYDNVVVVQLGTILLPPQQPQQQQHARIVNGMALNDLKLMRWLTIDLGLKYDYHITIDGASFPLIPGEEMARRLYASSNSVWLGTLTEQGKRGLGREIHAGVSIITFACRGLTIGFGGQIFFNKTCPCLFLCVCLSFAGKLVQESKRKCLSNKRLSTSILLESVTLGAIFPPDESDIPDFLLAAKHNDRKQDNNNNNNIDILNEKTMPGSLAVFSQPTIRRVLSSSQAMQVFAMSKYACCSSDGCMDHYNWMAALQLLDHEEGGNRIALHRQARINTAVFQLWSATSDVGGTCHNIPNNGQDFAATLSSDSSRCYRLEHPQVAKAVHNESDNVPFKDWGIPPERLFLHGGDVLKTHLKHAKKIGFLFARPFDSSDPQSMALLNEIERGLT